MRTTIRDRMKSHFSDAEARVLCYALGPFSGPLVLHFSRYGNIWSVRFHAFHSILMTALWAGAWSALRLIEEISPWFLATFARQTRFVMNFGFLLVWALLLVTAYRGSRCAIVPFVHSLAVRLARKSEKHGHAKPAPMPASL